MLFKTLNSDDGQDDIINTPSVNTGLGKPTPTGINAQKSPNIKYYDFTLKKEVDGDKWWHFKVVANTDTNEALLYPNIGVAA